MSLFNSEQGLAGRGWAQVHSTWTVRDPHSPLQQLGPTMNHRSPFSPNSPVTQSSASISLHVLRPCLFSQIVTKGEATENCIFLQRGDITCKSSEVNTQSSGSWSFSFTVPCLSIQRGLLQPLVTPVPLSDSWLGSGILFTLVLLP